MKNINFIKMLLKIFKVEICLCVCDSLNEIVSEIQKNNEVFFASNVKKNSIIPLASEFLRKFSKSKINLLYINKYIKNLDLIVDEIMADKGIIILDNVNVKLNQNKFKIIYEYKTFLVYQKKVDGMFKYEDMIKRTNSISFSLNNKKVKTIGIGVFTFNHEKYIIECLESIFKQKGDYNIKLIIIDDCSNDKTVLLIDNFLKRNKSKKIKVKFFKNAKNKGVISSFKKTLTEFKETDYFTFCEGDDFWNSSFRIDKFVKYLNERPFVSVAFNSINILDDSNKLLYKNTYSIKKEYYLTQELIDEKYFIGNLGCSFYNAHYLKYIDNNIFDLPLYDFFFNTYYSTFGLIAYYDEYLSTYRKHYDSFWSSLNSDEKNVKLINYIKEYNNFFNYCYDYEYCNFTNYIINNTTLNKQDKFDLLIIDNIFPIALSPFTYEEITNYLYEINNSFVLCTYKAADILSSDTIEETFKTYKKNNSVVANKIFKYSPILANKLNTRFMYFIFKNTVDENYELLRKKKIPFAFELYPGGGMLFNDKKCDEDLRKIMKLKNFKKVIVTQEPVKKYLISKKLCKPSQIEMIFGVVMNNMDNQKFKKETYYGKKDTLDIVFMAHKYTKYGEDKGYDLFIEMADELAKKYSNIKYHVVGNFDKDVIVPKNCKENIIFYGTMDKLQFDNFFKDKDLIISANRPNILLNGAFDGFPTASCTEAGIRETLILCTDELNMCNDYYKNMENIIIIKPDVNDIIEKVELLYNDAKLLRKLAKNCRKNILKLYSYDSQMKPRIKLLKKLIEEEK